MAADWIDMVNSNGTDYAARIKELGEQIEELDETIAVTTAVTARQAARKKLDRKAAEEAVDRAVRPLNDELAGLEELRNEAVAWQEGSRETCRSGA
ncbi:hypothetical protein [Streptomyces sp. H27-C3]|uniref:hypothetical protein n=1 Tax=Streptomyces sp. H27-C3 TaxID=3046305 RepID=UPI0024B9C1EB|nr:hypothetical protein [Streptomyces sp. H27-C3]MDJ0462596.1 hypothetical protein [Streptomyces sp. H27-C3]